jgi:hypothetical protein
MTSTEHFLYKYTRESGVFYGAAKNPLPGQQGLYSVEASFSGGKWLILTAALATLHGESYLQKLVY